MTRARTRSFRPALESLETRLTPAGNVTTFQAGGLLIITGDAAANDLVINPTGVARQFQVLSGNSATTINGAAGPVTLNNVTAMIVNLNAGNDTLTLNQPLINPFALTGNLNVNGGLGNNTVIGSNLNLAQNLTVVNLAGTQTTNLSDFTIAGGLLITNTQGDTNTTLSRTLANLNTVGNLFINNGAGFDQNFISDTSVTHAAVIANGQGGANGGSVNAIGNITDAADLATFGSLAISTATGTAQNVVSDVRTLANLAIESGTGAATTTIAQFTVPLAPVVGGTLAVHGTGANQINLGDANAFGAGGVLDGLTVNGGTSIQTGAAADVVNIRGATFNGSFVLFTGAGDDTVNLQTTPAVAGFDGTTVFRGVTTVNLGAGGSNTLNLANDAANQVQLIGPAFNYGAGIITSALFHGGSFGPNARTAAPNLLFAFNPVFLAF